jgi:hypothetical protein
MEEQKKVDKEDDWMITIRKVQNGYICEYHDETIDGYPMLKKLVFEEKTDEDLQTMKEVLWFIKEYFGIFYSKHNEQNLDISVLGEQNGR